MEKLKKWFDNYWYHYKWPTILAAVAVLFISVSVAQCASRVINDALILYAGPLDMTPNEKAAIEKAVSSVLPYDKTGDGELLCELTDITILTDEQILAYKKEAAEYGESVYVNMQNINTARNAFVSEMFAGESVVCIVDPGQYESILKQGGWRPIADILGYTPDSAYDSYGIEFAKTKFYKYFTACHIIPDDSIICVKQPSVISEFKPEEARDENFVFGEQLFKSIVEFEYPIGYEETGE